MKDQLVEINIHGCLGDSVGKNQWHLYVSSITEALRAVDINTNRKFSKSILDLQKTNGRYKILIDSQELEIAKQKMSELTETTEIKEEDIHKLIADIKIKRKMKRIDIVPVVDGAFFFLVPLFAAIGSALAAISVQTWIMLAISLVITGISILLSKPPDFGDFKEIEQVKHKDSYLFNGPVNSQGEGGAIPVGYGHLIVGSLGIQTSQTSRDKLSDIQDTTPLSAGANVSSTVIELIYDLTSPPTAGFGPQVLSSTANEFTTTTR